jgi:plasmid stabilization system protein ParE
VKLLITPLARAELKEAIAWYTSHANVETGLALLTEFEAATSLILGVPGIGPLFLGKRRRYVLHKFPYSIIYHLENDEVQIIALAHHKRRPGYWAKRKAV